MPNPGFIVEGKMEQAFVQNICPSAKVICLGLNGERALISGIAARIKSSLNGMKRNYPIVIVFDREGRSDSCEVLRQELIRELRVLEVDTKDMIIGIADRMTENWMLADGECVASVLGLQSPPPPAEGKSGKGEIRKLVKHASAERRYREVGDGARMLKRMNPDRAAENSPSFRRLFEQIDFECWWKDRSSGKS